MSVLSSASSRRLPIPLQGSLFLLLLSCASLTASPSPSSGPSYAPSSSSSSSSSRQRAATSSCIPIPPNLTLCYGLQYHRMTLPNYFEQETLKEVTSQASSWVHLVNTGCHPDTQVFLCSLYAPICFEPTSNNQGSSPSGGPPSFVGPCRSLCGAVRDGCEAVMMRNLFSWPSALNCSRFPVDNDLCIGVISNTTADKSHSTHTCPVCSGQKETFASIIDNYCHSQFAFLIGVDSAAISDQTLTLTAASHKKVFRMSADLTRTELRRLTVNIDNYTTCRCARVKAFVQLAKQGDKNQQQQPTPLANNDGNKGKSILTTVFSPGKHLGTTRMTTKTTARARLTTTTQASKRQQPKLHQQRQQQQQQRQQQLQQEQDRRISHETRRKRRSKTSSSRFPSPLSSSSSSSTFSSSFSSSLSTNSSSSSSVKAPMIYLVMGIKSPIDGRLVLTAFLKIDKPSQGVKKALNYIKTTNNCSRGALQELVVRDDVITSPMTSSKRRGLSQQKGGRASSPAARVTSFFSLPSTVVPTSKSSRSVARGLRNSTRLPDDSRGNKEIGRVRKIGEGGADAKGRN